MLAECKEQPQERHEKHAAADANIPAATPHTHATAKIPASRAAVSDTGFLLLAAGQVRIALRLPPEQKSRQHQEATEQSLQVPGRHGKRDQTPGITAEQHPQGAENSGLPVHLALLPVFAQRA